MPNIIKPTDINKIWSASGDVLAPSDTKIAQGWGVEIPPRQYFNYIDGKQDQAIAHINQHGIALWDSLTEYQANTSYTQGSDGVIYKALVTNTNTNPVGTTGTWQVAFSTPGSQPQVATPTQARAQTADNVFISPLQLANAFNNTNQSLAITGYQKFPGGMILQWGQTVTDSNGFSAQTLPIAFPNAHLQATCSYQNGARNAIGTHIASLTQTTVQVFAFATTNGTAAVSAIVKWVAVGW